MGGVRTNATVQVLGENRFDVTLHFSDAFEGGELTPGEDEKDATII